MLDVGDDGIGVPRDLHPHGRETGDRRPGSLCQHVADLYRLAGVSKRDGEAMIVAPIPVGARLADTIAVITAAEAKALKTAGIDGMIRYWESLASAEVTDILAAGMGLCVVGYSRQPGWVPSATLGAVDAQAEIMRCRALFGASLQDMILWCDLEGCAGPAPVTAAYLDAFGAEVTAAGALAGVYVGATPGGLDGPGLYAVPTISRYWRSQSFVPEPTCGYCLTQLYPTTSRGGVSVDLDFAGSDYHGRVANWLVSSP